MFTCIVGGLVAGVVGAILMTGVAFWPAAIRALATPGSSNNVELYPECSLLPDTSEVVDQVKETFFFCAQAHRTIIGKSKETIF